MKKIALVLAVLLVVSGAAFAEVMVGGEATVAGSVSTTFGMDIESNTWGADADSSITLKVPFVNGSAGASGDDEIYGEIMISDIGVNWNSDEFEDADYDGDNFDGDISAKIVAGDLYIGLNSGDYNNNYASGTEDYDVNLSGDWYGVPAYGDLAFGFDNGMIAFEVGVAAKSGIERSADETYETAITSAWTGDADTTTVDADADAGTQTGINGVVVGADLSYTSDMAVIPVYVTLDNNYMGDLLLAVSTDPSFMFGDLTLTLPVDFVMWGDDKGIDLGPTISYMVTDAVTLGADAYYYRYFDNQSFLNAGVTVSTDGLVDGLTASLDFDLSNVYTNITADELGWGVDVALGYAIADGISVSLDPGYDSTGDFDLAAGLSFGAAATGIDNTVLSVDYASATFGTNANAGIISATATVSF